MPLLHCNLILQVSSGTCLIEGTGRLCPIPAVVKNHLEDLERLQNDRRSQTNPGNLSVIAAGRTTKK